MESPVLLSAGDQLLYFFHEHRKDAGTYDLAPSKDALMKTNLIFTKLSIYKDSVDIVRFTPNT